MIEGVIDSSDFSSYFDQKIIPSNELEDEVSNTTISYTYCVILSSTIFHPQGGGQPSDVGDLIIELKEEEEDVRCQIIIVKTYQDVILHFISSPTPLLSNNNEGGGGDVLFGCKVTMSLNSEVRCEHAKLHSGGHLLDSAFNSIGFSSQTLVPKKGYHFPDGPYVEYKGNIPAEEREGVIKMLEERVNEMVEEASQTENFLLKASQIQTDFPELSLPSPIDLEQELRVVIIGGCACLCGGTHVNNSGDIGKMKIKGFRKKKQYLRVSYELVVAERN